MIKELVVNVGFGQQADLLQRKRHIERYFKYRLLPKLTLLLDGAADADGDTLPDAQLELELNLGSIPWHNIDNGLSRGILTGYVSI